MASHGYAKDVAMKPRKKVLHEMSMKRAANGGFIVKHHFDNSGPGSGYHEPEEHTFGKGEGAKMLSHVGEHMGISKAMKQGESD